jgi:hypothetical protein
VFTRRGARPAGNPIVLRRVFAHPTVAEACRSWAGHLSRHAASDFSAAVVDDAGSRTVHARRAARQVGAAMGIEISARRRACSANCSSGRISGTSCRPHSAIAFVFGYDAGSRDEAVYRQWYAQRYHKPVRRSRSDRGIDRARRASNAFFRAPARRGGRRARASDARAAAVAKGTGRLPIARGVVPRCPRYVPSKATLATVTRASQPAKAIDEPDVEGHAEPDLALEDIDAQARARRAAAPQTMSSPHVSCRRHGHRARSQSATPAMRNGPVTSSYSRACGAPGELVAGQRVTDKQEGDALEGLDKDVRIAANALEALFHEVARIRERPVPTAWKRSCRV